MPNVREVYEMVTKQSPPQPDALERQHREQRARSNRRKAGAYALVACLTIAAVLIAVGALRNERNGIENRTSVHPVAPLLFTIDLRSGATTPFTSPGPDAQGFDVSADGRKIAYAAHDAAGNFQIFVMDSDGSHRIQLTHHNTRAVDLAWSPDGSQIAYTSGAEIFVLDVGTERSTRLTTTSSGRPASSPTWNPTGKLIAFGDGTDTSSSSIYTVDVATHATNAILDDAGFPAWSPDGHQIAFNTWSVAHVTLANADGSARRDISHTDSCCADWSPNGSRIAYSQHGVGRVYVYDVATGKTRRAAAAGSIESWLDDHTLLIAKSPDQ